MKRAHAQYTSSQPNPTHVHTHGVLTTPTWHSKAPETPDGHDIGTFVVVIPMYRRADQRSLAEGVCRASPRVFARVPREKKRDCLPSTAVFSKTLRNDFESSMLLEERKKRQWQIHRQTRQLTATRRIWIYTDTIEPNRNRVNDERPTKGAVAPRWPFLFVLPSSYYVMRKIMSKKKSFY